MTPRQRTLIGLAILALTAFATALAWQAGWDIARISAFIERNSALGALAFVGAFVVSTVLPVSALPLLPLAAHAYGVSLTVLMSTCGWWIGSLIAFLLARWGRRHLARFVSLDAIDRFEQKIPAHTGFTGILVLRVAFPGDLVGFALGLLKDVRFLTFALASLLGTLPGAILLSYAGGELGRGHFVSFAAVIAATLVAALVVRRLWPAKSGI